MYPVLISVLTTKKSFTHFNPFLIHFGPKYATAGKNHSEPFQLKSRKGEATV